MSKTRKIMGGILLFALFVIISCLIWWKSEPPDKNDNGDTGAGLDANHITTPSSDSKIGKRIERSEDLPPVDPFVTTPSSDSKIGKRIERSEDLPPVDPFEMVEKFDAKFVDLLDAEGDEWAAGLEDLAVITNRLGEQSDFQSVTVSALMVVRISDLAIARLMAAEISAEDTLRGLGRLTYSIPSDRRLIDFICELHPEGEEQRRKNPPRSVDEFVSRFEEEAIMPTDEWSKKKTATGIATSKNATARLLYIGGAQMWLHAAQITAIYLKRGGDSSLTGAELEADLTLLVGKEIEKLPIPLLGEEDPTAATIGFLIDNAETLYQHR